MIDALPLGEIGGQHAPLDPAFGHIKDGIEHGSHTEDTRAATTFGGGEQIFDPLPFLVGQIAWIGLFVHISMLHNPRRLFRQALRSQLSTSVVPKPPSRRSTMRCRRSGVQPRRGSISLSAVFSAGTAEAFPRN